MKKAMKKLMAALLAVAMVCAMVVPAMAAGDTTSITINGTGKTFEAYRLLDATHDGSDKYSYTFNSKYESILKNATSAADLNGVLAAIRSYTTPSAINGFAETVWNAIHSNAAITADVTTTTKSFDSIPQGYYLIVEKETADHVDGTVDDTYSLLMLDTAGKNAITVNTKENSPELTKKVKEKNDTTGIESDWQDGADYDIGDSVPFQLTGTVSEKYDSYKTYKYVFHDKMSDGLTFNKDSVVVKVDGTTVTGYTIKTSDDSLADGCTFEVIFDDLKSISSVTASSKITVDYTATLNASAKIGSAGNPNEARLEFANNPYGDGTGKTPWDKVIVFTYKLVVNKVDNTKAPLTGAGFTLYKKDSSNNWNPVGAEQTGKNISTFIFTGLDAGTYKLVETTVPGGYNQAADLIFKVTASYDTSSANPAFTELKVTDENDNPLQVGNDDVFALNSSAGSLTTEVINNSGTVLPSTGGIGTTIFYIIGGGLMVAAAVLLITKKRMENKN